MISKPGKSGIDKFVGGRNTPAGSLPVKRPAENELRRAVVLSRHPAKPIIHKVLARILLKEHGEENGDRLGHTFEPVERQWRVQMLMHHFRRGTAEIRSTSDHLPEHSLQRVEVRADVH